MNEMNEYTFVVTERNGIPTLKCDYCTASEAERIAAELLRNASMVWYDTPAAYKSINAFMFVVASHLHIRIEFASSYLDRLND